MDEELMDELYDRLEEMIVGEVTCALQDAIPEVLAESLADFEFLLKDGTLVRPRPMMKLLSPDRTKLLLCYGGLRVDGCTLVVQTAISRWEGIAYYQSKEEAVAALLKVKEAMEANVPLLEM